MSMGSEQLVCAAQDTAWDGTLPIDIHSIADDEDDEEDAPAWAFQQPRCTDASPQLLRCAAAKCDVEDVWPLEPTVRLGSEPWGSGTAGGNLGWKPSGCCNLTCVNGTKASMGACKCACTLGFVGDECDDDTTSHVRATVSLNLSRAFEERDLVSVVNEVALIMMRVRVLLSSVLSDMPRLVLRKLWRVGGVYRWCSGLEC